MNVKNLTKAAVLSAAFVISSLIFIGLGFGYFGYIDFVVPVFMAIILLKCDLKYSVLSSITSFLLIIFVIGDAASAVMMVQSMILGIIIGLSVKTGKRIIDDILFCSFFSCFLIIVFDISFSVLTGYSLLKECQEYLQYVPSDFAYIKDVVFYITVSVLPVGTVILCYLLTLILGRKLRVLNRNALIKSEIVIKYKKYGGIISCSKNAKYISILLLAVFISVNKIEFMNGFIYVKIICDCEACILIFFMLQDSFAVINKFIFFKTNSRIKLLLCQLINFWLLLNFFKTALAAVIIAGLFLENKYKIKSREENILNKVAESFV